MNEKMFRFVKNLSACSLDTEYSHSSDSTSLVISMRDACPFCRIGSVAALYEIIQTAKKLFEVDRVIVEVNNDHFDVVHFAENELANEPEWPTARHNGSKCSAVASIINVGPEWRYRKL